MLKRSPAQQLNLLDMGLKTTGQTGAADFTDTAGERLKQLVWYSDERHELCYDDADQMTLTKVRVCLKGARRLNKRGKFEFVLLRRWDYKHLDEMIEDEVPCWKLGDLESCFNDEKFIFEQLRTLPSDVLFDGRRYCWKFKEQDGRVEFLEKWIGDEE